MNHMQEKCQCGKVSFSFEKAVRVFQRIFFRRAFCIKDGAKRQEKSYYRCPISDEEVWHLTSMYDSQYLEMRELKRIKRKTARGKKKIGAD